MSVAVVPIVSLVLNSVVPFFTINPLGICVIFISLRLSLVISVDFEFDDSPVVIASSETDPGFAYIFEILGATTKRKSTSYSVVLKTDPVIASAEILNVPDFVQLVT